MKNGRPISEDDLHAFVDGALDASRCGEVESYLQSNADVAERVAGFARQRDLLRAALGPIAQEPVPPELSLERLVEAQRRWPMGSAWRSVAAAALLLALGGGAGWVAHGTRIEHESAGIAALAQEATDSFRVYGDDRVRPVELKATDQEDLVRWISARLDHPVAVPDLTKSGYRFMGGRLVATAHGPAGMFMFDDDRGSRVVMLVRPMAAEKNTPMSHHEDGTVGGFAWARDGIGYSLVGTAAPDILHPIADDIRRQLTDGTI